MWLRVSAAGRWHTYTQTHTHKKVSLEMIFHISPEASSAWWPLETCMNINGVGKKFSLRPLNPIRCENAWALAHLLKGEYMNEKKRTPAAHPPEYSVNAMQNALC